jgi:hypothetical protein
VEAEVPKKVQTLPLVVEMGPMAETKSIVSNVLRHFYMMHHDRTIEELATDRVQRRGCGGVVLAEGKFSVAYPQITTKGVDQHLREENVNVNSSICSCARLVGSSGRLAGNGAIAYTATSANSIRQGVRN